MAVSLQNTVKDLTATHAVAASAMADRLAQVASDSANTASQAIHALANSVRPQAPQPAPQRPGTGTTRINRPPEAFTPMVRERIETEVTKDGGGGGGGIAIAAAAALALLALGAR